MKGSFMRYLHRQTQLVCWILLLALGSQTGYAAERITYIHTDALGSPVAATNELGEIVWREHYIPFGEKSGGNSEREEIAFTGKSHDNDTGLTYFGARNYDPVVGRFLSVDPVGFVGGNIHSFNKYVYANNNPYTFVDPGGEFAIAATLVAIAVASFVHDIYDLQANPNLPGDDSIRDTSVPDFGVGGALRAGAKVVGKVASKAAKGGLPKAAASIDSATIREIERRVRSGETSFPLDSGAQLRAVAESFKSKIQRNVAAGNIDKAKHIQTVGKKAVDRLDRFDALTPEARQQLKHIIDSGL